MLCYAMLCCDVMCYAIKLRVMNGLALLCVS
jgi:hypothetical protein